MTKQQHVVEVSASSAPSEVVGAIVSSATKREQSRDYLGNLWIKFAFAFIFVFALIVYFREEIYAFSTDLHKYPILSSIETLQIKQNLGTNWTFTSGNMKGAPAVALPLNASTTLATGNSTRGF